MTQKEKQIIRFFPGNIKEYERHVGYGVEVVDFGWQDLGIYYNKKDKVFCNNIEEQMLLENGVEALVNCQYVMSEDINRYTKMLYGLPVRNINYTTMKIQ